MPPPPAVKATVYEFYNQALDHYFITWVPAEVAGLNAGALRGWKQRLNSAEKRGPGARARLLEALAEAHPESTRTVSPLLSPSLQRRLSRKDAPR